MKKILHISKYYNPYVGGIESVAEEIVNTLKDTNEYEQKVICFGNEKESYINDIEIIRVPYKFTVLSQTIAPSYTKILRKTIADFKPDIILFHAPNPFVARCLLKCDYKGKLVIFHHSDIVGKIYAPMKALIRPYLRRIYTKADKIIALSPNHVKSEELYEYKDKCIVIPLFYKNDKVLLNTNDIKEVKRFKNQYKYPIAIFTGRLAPIKGLQDIIPTLNMITGVDFIIVGNGPLKKKLCKISKNKNIHFIGEKKGQEFRIALNAADFFILPSRYDSSPLSLIEAVGAGKPAVVYSLKYSAANWISLNDVTGIECEFRNVSQFKTAIERLRDNKDLRIKMSSEALIRAQKLFSERMFISNITKFFNNL